jgi:hypothetical protein
MTPLSPKSLRKKPKKIKLDDVRKKLQSECEQLWKQYCHTDIFQIDHCFSRTIKELFLDVANGTKICSACNMIKGSGKIGASKKDAITVAVHTIVLKREGDDVYKRLLEVASSKALFLDWKSINWLKTQKSILEDLCTH